MKKSNKIIGFHSGHDCSYCIFENGIPIVHNELERFTRKKEHLGDALNFLFPCKNSSSTFACVSPSKALACKFNKLFGFSNSSAPGKNPNKHQFKAAKRLVLPTPFSALINVTFLVLSVENHRSLIP